MANGVDRGATEQRRRSFFAPWRDYTATMVVTATVFAVGGGILALVTKGPTGDEPPIRVKGGSIDLDLLTATNEWKPVGSSGQWKIRDGQRSKDPLQVTLVSTTCGTQEVSGSTLTIEYTDPNGVKVGTVQIRSFSKRTLVTPTNLTLTHPSPQRLKYDAQGYISSITLDGTTLCRFQSKEQLTYFGIFDF